MASGVALEVGKTYDVTNKDGDTLIKMGKASGHLSKRPRSPSPSGNLRPMAADFLVDDLGVFLNDVFGVSATSGSTTAHVLLDQPSQVLAGDLVLHTDYQSLPKPLTLVT